MNTIIKKIAVSFFVGVIVMGATSVRGQQKEGDVVVQDDMQDSSMIKDEGYANDDSEYFGSEDEIVNEDQTDLDEEDASVLDNRI